jgi:nucleoside diphosphate kinase
MKVELRDSTVSTDSAMDAEPNPPSLHTSECVIQDSWDGAIETTLALIYPTALNKEARTTVLHEAMDNGLCVLAAKAEHITLEQAREFLFEKQDEAGFDDICHDLSSGVLFAVCLQGPCAVKHWQYLIRELARVHTTADSLHMPLGAHLNDVTPLLHASASRLHAERELAVFFDFQVAIEAITSPSCKRVTCPLVTGNSIG